MKELICLILAAALLFILSSCYLTGANDSIYFYYLRSQFTHGASDSVIVAEVRELSGNYEITDLIRQYLNGPLDSTLKTPFPADTSLITFENEAGTVSITLSDQIGALTGVSLSLACTCLAKTVMELTDSKTVHISAETLALNGRDYLSFEADTVLLLDDGIPTTDSVAE